MPTRDTPPPAFLVQEVDDTPTILSSQTYHVSAHRRTSRHTETRPPLQDTRVHTPTMVSANRPPSLACVSIPPLGISDENGARKDVSLIAGQCTVLGVQRSQ